MSDGILTRLYVRNGVFGLPPGERQLEILNSAGFSGPVYRDELSRNDMRTRNVGVALGEAARPDRIKERDTSSWLTTI